MTCTEVKRSNAKVTLPTKPKSGRVFMGVLLAVLLVCVAVVVSLFLHNANVEQQIEVQQEHRDDMIAELERNEGTYDAQSIVLYNTSRAKAEELAEKLGASLRMTKDGSFATLTLPEGTTILDVHRDEANLAYLEQMSADYQVKISELIEGEEDEEGSDERLPMRPTYNVSDTDYEMQTYLDYMNMQNVWASYTGAGVTIAVIDTGIDTDHPEFAGRISEYSYNATEDKIVKDYVLENGEYDWSLVEDEQGHGTAVTGVIAASMNSGNVVGIAPDVTIITIKAECNEDGTFKRTSDLVFGLYYAIERDVSVVNMSFGTYEPNPFAEATQLAYDSDVICVAAAGNDSTAALCYPAADPLVIGVGALTNTSWELAEYSNYGENVNIVAPGTTYTTLMGGAYGNMTGTSLSCPAVTGLIALYMQNNPYIMFDQVTEELYASCYELGDLGRDWYYGFGAVDANAFLMEERGTVTYDMLTDEVEDMEGTFIQGHALQELPEPDRLYAIFDGWYYDQYCTQRVEYYTDAFYGDITLYANWVNEDDGIPFTYVILEDGTVEIRSYTGHRRFITVPEKIEGRVVSSIGDFAFAGETNLREVGLPSGLRHIGLNAFAGCYNLVSMYIPENVTEIEVGAFANCVRLSTVAFTGQSKLLTIGNFAFEGCGKLRTIELPATLQSVNGTAFKGTSALISIRVQSGNQYFKSEDGVLFDISGETLVAYPAAHGTTYEIPESVKTVGIYAFYGSKVLFMDLGSTVERIETSAFESSSVLAAHIPDSVTFLGQKAFAKSAIKELTLGNGLTVIPMEAFAECSSLRSVHIPEGILEIKTAAFSNSHLETLTFAENSRLWLIYDLAFACCGITEVEIPASVVYIGFAGGETHDPFYYSDSNAVGVFDFNPLTDVTFAEGSQLKVIGDRAFAFTRLESIDLPEGLEQIGAGAFWTTPLETVMLPASLTVLEEAVFGFFPKWGTSQLASITVTEGNLVYHDVYGVVYNLANTEIHAFPAGRGGEYTVLDTVRKVMPYSFAGTTYLERVTLSEGLTEIGNYAFAYSGSYSYDLPSTLRYIKNGGFYSNFRLSSITLPEGLEQIAEYAFYGCSVLPTIHIPDSVMQIGRYAFAMDWNLYSVTFNETAKLPRISFGAFAYCGLQSFRVPANVSTMAQYAFAGCDNLTSFTFSENSKLESISAYMFDGCSNLQTITFEQGSALTSVQAHGLEGMDKLTQINWGDAKVTNIDNFAFRFCESLSYLTLPETVTNVGRYAFYGCKSLSELTLPANVEHIGMFAFLGTGDLNLYFAADNMPAYLDEDWDHGIRGYYVGVTNVQTQGDYKYATLTSGDVSIIEYLGSNTELDLSVLNFGAPITAIGGSAFEDKGITHVTLPETLTSIQAEAFAYNPLEEITIPAGVTFIGREAFAYTEIASLTFAEGSQIKTIEQYAFERTRNLTEVTLPASLTTMGRGVFQQSGLTNVTFEEGIALARIPENAFAESKLTSIALPDSVNYVDHNAFREIPTLQSVSFGNAESISLQSNSFYHTGLTSLHIPANVTYIGEYSFVALSNLTEITVDENNPYYKSEDGLLLSKDGRKLIVVPAGREGSLTVPASVEMLGFGAFEETQLSEVKFDPNANILTLGYRAFFKANNITSIDIPKSVISIDYYAFAYCENLQTVNFAEGNQLKGIYEGAFLGDINLENITIPDTIVEISDFAFYGCSKIDRIPIGENNAIKGIYSYAFAYTGIEGDFTTPETLIDIGDYAFLGTKITKLTVPDTNQLDLIIGIGAFEDCNKLEEVTLPFIGASLDNMEYSWFGYIFGAGAYEANETYVPESLKTVTITEGQTLVGFGGFAYLTNVETLNIPNSICVLYNDAFKDVTTPYTLTNTIMTWYWNGISYIPQVMQGHFGPGLTGHLELAGSGVMTNDTWTDGVTKIGWFAFQDCANMTSVTIPESVTAIENSSFNGCSGLTSITIPDGVTNIENYVFKDCTGLTDVNLPNSVIGIGMSSFEGCTSLTNVDAILDGLTEVGQHAFANCTALTSVTIPDGMTSVVSGMFQGCTNLTDVSLPESVTNIEWGAFASCSSLTDIVLPDAVTSIGEDAFYNCTNLLQITLPENLTRIDREAFYLCNHLYYIDNHSNLYLESGSDNLGCIAYYAIAVKEKNGTLIMQDGWGITDDGFVYEMDLLNDTQRFCRIRAYLGDEESLTIPSTIQGNPCEVGDFFATAKQITLSEGIDSIGLSSFSQCYNLQSLSIPASVELVMRNSLGTKNLANIEVSSDNEYYHVSGNCLIETQSKNLIWGTYDSVIPTDGSVQHILDGAFYACVGLTNIVIPDSVTSIGNFAFADCGNLEKLIIGKGVTSIGIGAFQNCSSLTEIIIPDSVSEIDFYAFYNCSGVLSITLPDNLAGISYYAFAYCSSLKNIKIPDNVTTIGECAFLDCSKLETIVISENITDIGNYAFYGCDSLKEVSLPTYVANIGKDAFSENTKVNYSGQQPFVIIDGIMYNRELTKIIQVVDKNITFAHIPDGVMEIGAFTFDECMNLKEVIIPNSVTDIGSSAFDSCTSLTTIVIPNGVKSIGGFAFRGCSKLTTVSIGSGTTVIGNKAFASCNNLVCITVAKDNPVYHTVNNCVIETATKTLVIGCVASVIPEDGSVAVIGAEAFEGSGIVRVFIPDSVVEIKDYAFGWCQNLMHITLGVGVARIGNGAFYGTSPMYIKNNSDLFLSIGSFDHGEIALNANIIVDKYGNLSGGCFSTQDGYYYQIVDGVYMMLAYFGPLNTITLPDTIDGHSYQIRYFKTTASHVILPQSMTHIGEHAFEGCSAMQSITIPDTVTSIGFGAFYGCNGLTEVSLPDSVAYMENNVFSGCSNLKRVKLSNGLTSIGWGTFERCGSLSSVIFPENVTEIGGIAFSSCTSLKDFTLPASVISIGERAFVGCTGLTDIIIPENVQSIERGAFANCVNLKNITISDNISKIAYDAFDNTAFYNNASNWIDGCLVLSEWLLTLNPDTIYMDTYAYNKVAQGVYADFHLLKNVIWNSSVQGATNIDTIVLKDIENNLPFNHPGYPETWLPVTVKNIIITKDVDLTELRKNPEMFKYVTGVTIYVEGNEKDLRWNDNFPGWNAGNRVVYGDEWSWVTFYDEQGSIISQEPCKNTQIIRKPIAEDKEDAANTYVFGWDIDGDGIADSVPATTVTDLEAHPVYTVIPKEYTVTFKDSETGEIYKQDTLHYGDTITPPETPTRENSFLVGWRGYTEGMTVTGNLEFVTNWHVHEMGEWYESIAPTCTTDGENRRDCSGCDYHETEVLPALGHTESDAVEENRTEPTCTETGGYDTVVYCSVCNAELSRENTEINALGHTDGEIVVENNVDPTCTENGSYDNVVYCTVCGAELSRETFAVDALGHDMGEWYQTIAPTCTTEGENRRDCGRCDHFETEVVPANGHTSVDAFEENRFAPTCTEVGGYDMVVYCSDCGDELSREHTVIEALGHNMGEWYQTIAPACTTEGQNRRDCSHCDYFETEVVAALGHTPADAVEENHVNPTCTESGGYDMAVYCAICGTELSRENMTIPAAGHSHKAVITAPTCTEQGYTTHTCHCGDVYVDSYVDALGHTEVIDAAVASTCTESGLTEGKHCSVCNEVLVAQEVVPATGHSYESAVTNPTCTEKGYTTHTCHCGDSCVDSEVAALGHTPSDWIVDTEPAIGIAGSKHKECTACGETLETEAIDALTEAPTTEAPTIEPPITEPESEQGTAPETESNTDSEKSGGCNGTISASVALLALLGCFAVAWRPRKDN